MNVEVLKRNLDKFRHAKALAAQFSAPVFSAKAEGESGDLLIYDSIGAGWFDDGITAKTVAEKLAEMKGVTTLNVFVNSPGGSIFEGVAIYNEIRRFAGKKIVHVDGIAASAASMIAMAGDEIVMAHNALMMIHEGWGMAVGNATEMREVADILEKITEDSVLGSYARTGQTKEQLRSWMKAETWMNAQEAKERGFADVAEEPPKKKMMEERPAAKERAVNALLENPRDFEARLRDVLGLSQSEAKKLMAEGYKALAPTRDVADEALSEVSAAMDRFHAIVKGSTP